MSRQPIKALEPERFCVNDGEQTGIHVAEGVDLCLDCYRAYCAAKAAPASAGPAPAARSAGQADLFGAAA